jgi:hypothetical protein
MTWALVVVGGASLIGAGASYAGAKKQAKGAEKGAQLNMDMFNTLNRQQQPYIQSGYGAQGRLNTLLGINPNPNYRQMSPPGPAYRPTPGGGVQPIMQVGQQPDIQIPERGMGSGNARLRQLLALRASKGDRSAGQILQGMV